ncbi:T9SS type A sorting domain-containing protein, partial [Pontibacter virosus]
SPSAVGSVKFELSGAQSKTFTDSKAPYALHGDNGRGNYYFGNWNPPATGAYTLKATPYTGAKATGTTGTHMTINFTIVKGDKVGKELSKVQVTPPGLIKHPSGTHPVLEKLSVYPNPFSDKARVRFIASENEDYTVSLYDSKGTLLRVIHHGRAVSGQVYELDFDGSDLGKGLYMIRLQSSSENETFKLMLER